MRHFLVFFSALLAAALASCGLVYTDVKVPRGYRTAAPSEVKSAPDDPTVIGEACNRSAAFLFAWGDASYAAAVKDALGAHDRAIAASTRRQDAADGIMYDVRADIKVDAYLLGLYAKVCTVLTGKVAKP